MKEFINVDTISDIDLIAEKSVSKMQILFKHSTVCPISRISYEKMKNEYPFSDEEADIYYVGVIEQRPISNYIADIFSVQHESPQVLLIKKKVAVFNESHLMINPKELTKYL